MAAQAGQLLDRVCRKLEEMGSGLVGHCILDQEKGFTRTFVRMASCPVPDDAVRVDESYAFCRVEDRACRWLVGVYAYPRRCEISCAASANRREEEEDGTDSE